MRRIAAVAVACVLFASPMFASKVEIQKKDDKAAKEKAAATKPGEPAKTAAGQACAPGTPENASKVPQTGSAGFFQTVEDIYAFQGPVADLVAPPAEQKAPAAPPAPAKSQKKDEPKKKAD